MTRVDVVSFDMEGTLVTHDFSRLIWENDIPLLYGYENNIDFETAKMRVMAQYDTVGDGKPEWYDIEYWFDRLEITKDWRTILEERSEACSPYPEAQGVLERLKQQYQLIISSNTIREFLEIQLMVLPDVFEKVYSAPSDFGTVKNSDFFQIVCEDAGIDPLMTVHIGDNFRFDYESSSAIGIRAFYLDRERKEHGPYIVQDLLSFEKVLDALN